MSIALQQMLETGRVPHPLLLSGSAKISDAIELAKKLMGPDHHVKIDSGNHPDLHFYAPEGKSHLHTMVSMKSLIQEMALPPFESTSKIFILDEAEKMLPSASNALLKTLEEPNEDSFVILICSRPEALLPTLRSRLHPVSFGAKEIQSYDLAFLFTLAQGGDWNGVFEALTRLEEEDPESLFQGVLEWTASKAPSIFEKASRLIEQAQKALAHNVKLKTVLLHLLLNLA